MLIATDQQPEDGDRLRDHPVRGDLLLLGVVVDDRPHLVAVCGERVLEPRRRAVDETVVVGRGCDPVVVDLAGRAEDGPPPVLSRI
jgi:hypothetical protein